MARNERPGAHHSDRAEVIVLGGTLPLTGTLAGSQWHRTRWIKRRVALSEDVAQLIAGLAFGTPGERS